MENVLQRLNMALLLSHKVHCGPPPNSYRKAWWNLLTTSVKLRDRLSEVVDVKLSAVLLSMHDLSGNGNLVTINSLQDLAEAVATQSNNQISRADAETMIAAAQEIIRPLRGPTPV